MKKNQILAGLFLAGITLGACTEDYTDWANPQSNAPEEAAAQYQINFAAGADAAIDMDKFYETIEADARKTDSVEIAMLSSSSAEVASIKMNSVNINGTAINAVFTDQNILKVNTLELDSVVRDAFFSRAHVERVLNVNMNVAVCLKNGEAVNISGTSQAKLTPISTPAVSAGGYAMLGDFVESNGWNVSTPVVMSPVAGKEGIFQATIETTTEGSNWFKFYEVYDVNGGWDAANAGQIGCFENGDDKTENFAVWTGDVYEVQTPVITGKGHFVVTFDAVNYTYSVAPATAYLYMAGDANGWKQVDALASPKFDNVYTGYMYLNQNGFKFCTQEDWNGTNYGVDFSTDGGADNITMAEEPGFYQVVVDLNEKSYKLTPVTTIGIIGTATPNGWDTDTDMELVEVSEEGKGTVHYWTVTADLAAGEMKFRANDDWTINWGGTPKSLTTDNGANLVIEEAGKYTINLYPLCEGKSYCTIEVAK